LKWWQTAWQLVRDIGLTGTGVYILIRQASSPDPSWPVIVGGLILCVPAVRANAATILFGLSGPPGGRGESSSPSSSLPEPPSLPGGASDAGQD